MTKIYLNLRPCRLAFNTNLLKAAQKLYLSISRFGGHLLLLPEILNFFDKVYLPLGLSLVLLLFLALSRGKFGPQHPASQYYRFLFYVFTLVFLDCLSTYLAYVYLLNTSIYLCLLFTLAFSLLNITYLNFIFSSDYAKKEFPRVYNDVSPLTKSYVDLRNLWFESLPLLKTFFFFLLFIIALNILAACFLESLFLCFTYFFTPIGVLLFYALFITFGFGFLNIFSSLYTKYVGPFLDKLSFVNVFSLSESQLRIIGFFKKHKHGLRDPFVLFLGLVAFLRESNLFFVLMYLFFFRYDGGLSFCLLATFYVFVSCLTFLPFTRRLVFTKYDRSSLADLSYNAEDLFVKYVLKKGPKAVILMGGITLATEAVVQASVMVEQLGINFRHSIRVNAANSAADSSGYPRPTPPPVPEAPRRSLLFKVPEKPEK